MSLLSSPSTPTLGRSASWQGSSEHCPSAPAPCGAVWPQGAGTEELALCARSLAMQWTVLTSLAVFLQGLSELRHSMCLAHSEPSVNGNRAEGGRGPSNTLAASEDKLDLEPKLSQSLCFSEVRFRRSLNSTSFLLFYR